MTPKNGWEERFLVALNKSPNVSAACRAAGVSRTIAYVRRDESETFRQGWDAAMDAALDALEEAAFQRAQRESDTLAIFLLKSHRPSRYRETTRQEVALTGFESWTDEELEAYARGDTRKPAASRVGEAGDH